MKPIVFAIWRHQIYFGSQGGAAALHKYPAFHKHRVFEHVGSAKAQHFTHTVDLVHTADTHTQACARAFACLRRNTRDMADTQ